MMAAHSVHPSIRDNGLADDCPRCAEHAERPFDSLDDKNLGNLLAKVVECTPARSVNEENALAIVRQVIHHSDRLARVRK